MAGVSPQEIEYQEAHITDDASAGLYASSITMMIVTATTVVLRLLCKKKLNAKITPDDFCTIFALFLVYGLCIELILCAQFGGGKHAIVVPVSQQVHMMQMIWIFEITYAAASTAIKASILLLLRRLFYVPVTPVAWRALWFFIMAWVILWFLGCGLATVFQCTPVSFFWNQIAGDTNGFCVNEYSFLAGNAALNIASDIMILMLPMPIVWRLHIKRSQKLAISSIFLLGGFVCICSIVRYTYLKEVIPVDVTFSNQPAGIWSLAEMSIGLVCASLPVMRPFLQYLVPGWVITLADSFDKKTLSWNHSPFTPGRGNEKSGRASVSSSQPTLVKPQSVGLSDLEAVAPKPEGDDLGKTPENAIVKSVSCSSTWTSDDDDKGLYGAYRSLP